MKPVLAAFIYMLLSGASACFAGTRDTVKCACTESDMSPAGIMAGHRHTRGELMLSYRYMNSFMKGKLLGGQSISDETVLQQYIMSPEKMSMHMHMLMAMYGISDRVSAMAMVSYSAMNMDMKMIPGSHDDMPGMDMPDFGSSMRYTSSGLGDTRLYLGYTFPMKNPLILSLGTSLPTGSIQKKSAASSVGQGQRMPYMMQLGSGTFDLLPAITYIFTEDNLDVGIQANGTYRLGPNRLGYTLPEGVSATAWGAYRFIRGVSGSLRVEASSFNRMNGWDAEVHPVMEPAANPFNYGGRLGSAYLGANIYLPGLSNSKLSVEYGLPVYQKVSGIQLATKSNLYAGWTIAF